MTVPRKSNSLSVIIIIIIIIIIISITASERNLQNRSNQSSPVKSGDTHASQLSLAIPPWVGAVSTDDGFGYRWGRNGEFCVAIGPSTRTAAAKRPRFYYQHMAVVNFR